MPILLLTSRFPSRPFQLLLEVDFTQDGAEEQPAPDLPCPQANAFRNRIIVF